MATACLHQNKIDKAATFAEQAYNLDSMDFQTLITLATIYHIAEDYEKVALYSLEAIKVDNKSAKAFHNLGGALYELGKYDEADKTHGVDQALAIVSTFVSEVTASHSFDTR